MEQKTPHETLMAAAEMGLMAGKRGLVMGVANDHSIAWGIAQTLSRHGAQVAFTYQGDAQKKRLGPLAESIGSTIMLPADVENDEQLDAAFAVLAREWGSIDFLVHAIATKLLMALLVAHIAGAVLRAFKGDGTLARMIRG